MFESSIHRDPIRRLHLELWHLLSSTGRFDFNDAIELATQALRLAEEQANTKLVAEIEIRLNAYRQGIPDG